MARERNRTREVILAVAVVVGATVALANGAWEFLFGDDGDRPPTVAVTATPLPTRSPPTTVTTVPPRPPPAWVVEATGRLDGRQDTEWIDCLGAFDCPATSTFWGFATRLSVRPDGSSVTRTAPFTLVIQGVTTGVTRLWLCGGLDPIECTLSLPTLYGVSEFGGAATVVSANHIDRAQTSDFLIPSYEVHIERVGSVGNSGGQVIQGSWVDYNIEYDTPRSWPELPGVEFAEVLSLGCEDVLIEYEDPAYNETVTDCTYPRVQATFLAFSLPSDLAQLPVGVSEAHIREVLRISSQARAGAITEEQAEAGFIAVASEIRAVALTWIVRNMPVYDATDGTWSSFETYAIELGRDSGVPPDSRLAQDPVGTAIDLAFGDATAENMIDWLGLRP